MNLPELVAFDLDGTLLNDHKQVDKKDWETLVELKKKGVIRVAATGRNFYSLQTLLPVDFPADFIVFSSGAGIYDCSTKTIIYKQLIPKQAWEKALESLLMKHLNFTVHLPIPDNHHIRVHYNSFPTIDMEVYLNHYQPFVMPLQKENLPQMITQFIVYLPPESKIITNLQIELSFLKTIVTSSPVNHSGIWLEIFHPKVSKAAGITWIINHLQLKDTITMGIGNDFNDIDLLDYTNYSFIVENAPEILKTKYRVVRSNNRQGFSEAVQLIFKI